MWKYSEQCMEQVCLSVYFTYLIFNFIYDNDDEIEDEVENEIPLKSFLFLKGTLQQRDTNDYSVYR